ncbi:hypothetical protein, partial [Salmonella enterica]
GFSFDGEGRFKPAQGGFGATVAVLSSGDIEVVSDTATASSAALMASVRASDLNALGAARLVVGGELTVVYGQGGNFVRSDLAAITASSVV